LPIILSYQKNDTTFSSNILNGSSISATRVQKTKLHNISLILYKESCGVKLAAVLKLPVKLIIGDHKISLLIMTDTSQETFSMQVQGSQSNIPPVFSGMLIEYEPTVSLMRVSFESFW